jgi:hypothetical protein
MAEHGMTGSGYSQVSQKRRDLGLPARESNPSGCPLVILRQWSPPRSGESQRRIYVLCRSQRWRRQIHRSLRQAQGRLFGPQKRGPQHDKVIGLIEKTTANDSRPRAPSTTLRAGPRRPRNTKAPVVGRGWQVILDTTYQLYDRRAPSNVKTDLLIE